MRGDGELVTEQRGKDRQHGGFTDVELEGIAVRIAYLLPKNDALLDALEGAYEKRLHLWLGRKAARLILLVAGAIASGAWLLIEAGKVWVKGYVGG